ncbi:Flp pilus assembly complex ATPase component TadA [Candidatus Sumerlaeota bacterium]|nr:Flp pilus assembly complex ATPase component TadA [Candidatus Sumerlaeota bacterium]
MINVGTKRIGEILLDEGKLNERDLDLALHEHEKTGDQLGRVIINMGLLSEEDVMRALATQLHIPFIRLSATELSPEIIQRIPAKIASHYHVVPLGEDNGMLKIATDDPHNIETLDSLNRLLDMEVEPVAATRRDIDEAIKVHYGIGAATMEQMMDNREQSRLAVDEANVTADVDEMAEDATIVRFVNQVVREAFNDRATDIHIEPMEKDLRIRYRIDGMLYEAAVPPTIKRFQSAIISRVKIMSDMNIAERRLPQDGKIKITMKGEEYDLRVSTVPTPYGESVAIRILRREESLIKLENQGLDEHNIAIIRDMISKPHGIFLVTGPTGSGKSTTLYGAISEINAIERKIITIEDPIEYRIEGVTQIQVHSDIGLTFASVLRTILRQDPDVIMVGEIRDTETAQISIRTALTGHLVFSTLHTNDSCGAVARLIDMGIEPFLVSSSVEGIVAQRLVRLLCHECKQVYQPETAILDRLNLQKKVNFSDVDFFKPVGCKRCRYTGHYGRTAIYEIVRIDEDIKRHIVNRDSANLIRKTALKNGMRTIRDDGFLKIQRGITTIDEVMRMTMEDEFAHQPA